MANIQNSTGADRRSPRERYKDRVDLFVGLGLLLVRGFVSALCGAAFWLACINHVAWPWALISSTVIGFVVLRVTVDWWR